MSGFGETTRGGEEEEVGHGRWKFGGGRGFGGSCHKSRLNQADFT